MGHELPHHPVLILASALLFDFFSCSYRSHRRGLPYPIFPGTELGVVDWNLYSTIRVVLRHFPSGEKSCISRAHPTK